MRALFRPLCTRSSSSSSSSSRRCLPLHPLLCAARRGGDRHRARNKQRLNGKEGRERNPLHSPFFLLLLDPPFGRRRRRRGPGQQHPSPVSCRVEAPETSPPYLLLT